MSTALFRARSLIELGRWQEALNVLAEDSEATVDNVQALCLGAQAHLGLGRPDQAQRLAQSAARLDPGAEWPLRLTSIAMMRRGNADEARIYADAAVRVAPGEWRTHMQRAQVDVSVRNVGPTSERAARRAIELAPDAAEAHLVLGNVALARGDLRLARSAFLDSLRLDPDNPSARNNLSVIDLRRHRPGRAMAGFRAAVRLDPQDRLPVDNLVLVLTTITMRLGIILTLTGLVSAGVAEGSANHSRLGPGLVGGVSIAIAMGYALRLRRPIGRLLPAVVRRAIDDSDSFIGWLGVLGLGYACLVVGAVLGTPVARGGFIAAWLLGIGSGRIGRYYRSERSKARAGR